MSKDIIGMSDKEFISRIKNDRKQFGQEKSDRSFKLSKNNIGILDNILEKLKSK